MTNEKALYLLEHGDWFQAVYNNLPESTAEQIAEAINTVAKTVRFTFYGDPLTLEQLRNMDGEPVWFDTIKRWGIVRVYGYEISVLTKSGEYDVTRMKFYRRPPEGEA